MKNTNELGVREMVTEAHVKLNEYVQFEQDEEAADAVLLDTSSGEIFSCNASAAALVREMVDGVSKSVLTRLLMDRYSLERAIAERDIQSLLEALTARGFLVNGSTKAGRVK